MLESVDASLERADTGINKVSAIEVGAAKGACTARLDLLQSSPMFSVYRL